MGVADAKDDEVVARGRRPDPSETGDEAGDAEEDLQRDKGPCEADAQEG